ncbi:LOW QUALITY PROTEIN: hypothetical protein U9M48_004969 [Paspalum notatum var. saurae]|uniref:Reverse transcriptase domain-containing protein n=1 Tax=Paspalum notatum var. saurae TaxID=547442 RepID=A0AAQ3PR49_PASNO
MVNHLLFADDCLFFKAKREGAEEVAQLLKMYCRASAYQLRKIRDSLCKGCRQNERHEIKTILNVQNESLSAKYLGMPTDVGFPRMARSNT